MDLNKEIKLSDLSGVLRRPKKSGTSRRSKSTPMRRPKRQEVIGLKIGASQIVASRVVNNGGPAAKLVQLSRRPLEPGIVVGGEVRDVPALARALDHFFTQEKLPRRGIRLGVGTNRIGVRSLDVEGIADERQLENAVRFRAHEALSIPMDEAVLDYHVVDESVDESGSVSRRVVLAAAYKEPIDHFVEACRAARLELAGIDVEAFALLRALAPSVERDPDAAPVAVVALSLGHDRSTLAISDGKICDFMRVLDWGGAKIDAAIGRDLGLTLEEANELKLELSLAEDAADSDDDPRRARAREAVVRELQNVARDVIASLQFYQSQPGSLAISEILVTGGTTRMPGLVEELERLTRVRVLLADPLGGLQAAHELAMNDDLASSAVAIGLGVES
jgi:type IV pilus assembly protein PilM